jgi:pilus assembly protein CpaC
MALADSFLPPCEGGGGKEEEGAPQEGAEQQTEQESCERGSVINMMEVGGAQQVMLEVKVAEIARTVLKRLDSDVNLLFFGNDLQFGGVNGGQTFPNALTPEDLEVPVFGDFSDAVIGPPIQKLQPNTPAIDDKGLFLSAISGDFLFQAVIEASRQKGLAKILAEPVLTTLTGQEAEFLSGGEFPIPVAQDLGQVTIEFKQFGVGVKFLPVVLDSGHISLKLNISVSELSSEVPVVLGVQGTAGTFLIPSLTKRSAGSTVELSDGQTIGIAGLISDNLRESVDKFPGLGDVPMLGPLFRSQEFQSGQTELVIFVTPHLARPIAANQVRLPTDSFIPPDDLDFYLSGRLEASEAPAPSLPQPAGEESTMSGRFGHEF